jgi:hypothetical protein
MAAGCVMDPEQVDRRALADGRQVRDRVVG